MILKYYNLCYLKNTFIAGCKKKICFILHLSLNICIYIYIHMLSSFHQEIYIYIYIHRLSSIHKKIYINIYIHTLSSFHQEIYIYIYIHTFSSFHQKCPLCITEKPQILIFDHEGIESLPQAQIFLSQYLSNLIV